MSDKKTMLEFNVEVCRIAYSTATLTVQAENGREAAAKANDKAGSVVFSETSLDYDINSVVNAQAHESVDYSEPLTGTVGDVIATMPMMRDLDWDREILDLEADSVVGRDSIEVLNRANALVAICHDYSPKILEAVVKQINVFYFG